MINQSGKLLAQYYNFSNQKGKTILGYIYQSIYIRFAWNDLVI